MFNFGVIIKVILRLDRRIQELFSPTGNTLYSPFGSCDQVAVWLLRLFSVFHCLYVAPLYNLLIKNNYMASPYFLREGGSQGTAEVEGEGLEIMFQTVAWCFAVLTYTKFESNILLWGAEVCIKVCRKFIFIQHPDTSICLIVIFITIYVYKIK